MQAQQNAPPRGRLRHTSNSSSDSGGSDDGGNAFLGPTGGGTSSSSSGGSHDSSGGGLPLSWQEAPLLPLRQPLHFPAVAVPRSRWGLTLEQQQQRKQQQQQASTAATAASWLTRIAPGVPATRAAILGHLLTCSADDAQLLIDQHAKPFARLSWPQVWCQDMRPCPAVLVCPCACAAARRADWGGGGSSIR